MTVLDAVQIANILLVVADRARAAGQDEITAEDLQEAFRAEDAAIQRLEELIRTKTSSTD